jgi:uncharacterized protein
MTTEAVGVEVLAIPIAGRIILYRPLLRLAFVGNEAMARQVLELAQEWNGTGARPQPAEFLSPEVADFLEGIGFLETDPPPPAPRETEYRPTSAVILATNRCNLRCGYCYASAGDDYTQEVPIELARTAIDVVHQNAVEVGRHGFELTFHGGGEPTLAWQTLEEAVDYARTKDLPCHTWMVSNGIWSERRGEWIKDNLDRVTISFDGTQETQDRQRPFASGQGSFDAVMRSIAHLDRYGFDYGIRMTALAPWRGQLARDVRFICEETACRSLQVEPAFNSNRGEYRPPSWQECQDFVAGYMEAFEIAERAGRRLHFSGARPRTRTSAFCSAPYGGLIVTPSGDLVTCYEITDRQHPLAGMCTIGRIEGEQVVLDREQRASFLSRLEGRRQACRDCFCYWHCAGDCHAKTFYPGIDTNPITSPRCKMNRAILAQQLLWFIANSEDGVYRHESSSPGS